MKWREAWAKIPAVYVRWLLIALCVILVLFYFRYAPPTAPWSPQSILGRIMPEPRVITRVEKVIVQGPERIRIVPKEKIVEVYRDLPTPATLADNGAMVTAVCDIPPSPGGGTAIAVLRDGKDNVAVGHIEFQPKKVPFFALQKVFGGRAGMGTGGLILGEIYAQPVRLGPASVEVRGYAERDDRSGADFGAAILVDLRF